MFKSITFVIDTMTSWNRWAGMPFYGEFVVFIWNWYSEHASMTRKQAIIHAGKTWHWDVAKNKISVF